MLSGSSIRINSRQTSFSKSRWGWVVALTIFSFALFQSQRLQAQTCVFDTLIIASDDPFGLHCPPGTDTIIIRDTLKIDINYEPIIGGVPFEGILLVDGGVIFWTSNVWFKLGYAAKVILINGGIFKPLSSNAPDCNGFRALYFDTKKTVDCNGSTAPHAFSDVNNAGCVTELGICCNAYIVETDSSGNYNDKVLCQPGDTAHLSVLASGNLDYDFFWTPNIGPEAGPYPVAPVNNTAYTVQMTAIFDPYGPDPAYLLTCSGSVTIRINKAMSVVPTASKVPCANVPTGSITLAVSGGTPGYTYLWSTGATTKDVDNLPAGTYTVTVNDTKGCDKIVEATIMVEDNTPPTLSCPANATDIADPGLCTTLVDGIDAVFSDNCPTVGVTYELAGATTGTGDGQLSNAVPFSSGVTTVTYTVDDGANAVSCTFTVTVNDTQYPTASNPAMMSGITCLAAVPAPDPSVVTDAADNCGPPAITHVGDVIDSGSGCPGDPLILLRSYQVSDVAGNSITVTQTISIVDNVPPAFTFVPGNLAVSCDAIPVVGTPTASDNCSATVSITYNGEVRIDGACMDSYTLRRQWTATDNCGNTTTAIQEIAVHDTNPPAFTFVPANVTVSCDAIPGVGNPTATDNCDLGVSIVYNGETRTDGACPDSYSLHRRWTATDNCGNTATAEQVIMVDDYTAPTFTSVPANVTVNCDAVPAVGMPAATDNCDGIVAIVYDGESRTDGACLYNYTLRRQWTATDNCGNTTTAQQFITVQDITPPVFTSVPANTTVDCSAIPPVGNPVAIDNCAANTTVSFIDEVRTNGSCPDSYTLTRRWMATDACGNTAMATQTVSVEDKVAPAFNFVPANITLSCDAIPPVGTPVATDNCAASVTINYDGEIRVDGACTDSYVLIRRWTATDNCGNTATAEQELTIQDTSNPVFISVPANVTVSCAAIPAVGNPAANDNCDVSVSITYDGETRVDGACADSYTLVRQWTATDNCGNTSSATQSVFVQDQVPPVFTFIPPDATVDCEAIPSLGTPTASDDCDGDVEIIFDGVSQNSGSCASGGTVTRRWIAMDNCGNTAVAEQMLTVQDTTKPVFVLVPAGVTVSCEAIPAVGTPEATDNCTDNVEINYNGETRVDGACADSYSLLRTWTATDLCGNTVTATQLIEVEDLDAPVFTFVPAPVTVSCDAVPAVGAPLVTDNCDTDVTVTYDGEVRTDGDCPYTYSLVRTWTAADNCGNSVSATQLIEVQDTEDPVFTFVPADVTVNCEDVPALETPTATDNCTASVTVTFDGETRTDGSCPDTYVLTRQWTISDDCGNAVTAQQTISVEDVTKPEFTFVPADLTVGCDAVPILQNPSATDNCTAIVQLVFNGETRIDGPCLDTYTLTRQWTISDNCGNSDTAEQIITVRDTVNPVFTAVPPNLTVDCDNIPILLTPVASDNCASPVMISYDGETRIDGACTDTYTLVRRWTATDNCGNTDTTEQIIEVQDYARPVFTFVPPNVTVDCAAVPAVGTPTASDNCATVVSISYDGETRVDGACPDTYTLIRRWTASDNCGNTEQAEQVITVEDKISPVFTSVPADMLVDCDAVPAVGVPTATDNCTTDVLIEYVGESRTDGACPDSYSLLRRWVATDNCGNTTVAEQMITVQDTTKPVFTFVPSDLLADCQDVPAAGTPTATDNCTASVVITYDGEQRLDGACPDAYTLVRRWTATDNCGNTAMAEQVIMVQDTTKPVFTFVPSSMTVDCDAVPAVGVPTATDNCTSIVDITYDGETRTNGSCPDNYTLNRRWTATDACGNSVTAEQILTVQDVTPPEYMFVPPDLTVNCESIPNMATPIASDNCDQDVSISVSSELLTNGNCTSGGVLIRTWTALDNCGNSAMATQALTVQDTTKPVFTFVPADLTVNCEDVPSVGAPTATDNCTSNVVITFEGEDRFDGDCPDTYTLRRRWSAADICGNVQTTAQVITVQDVTAPLFTNVPDHVTVSCEAIPTVGTPVATDNCDSDITITYDGEIRTDGACPDTYVLLRQWTAADNCGNTVSTTQLITVQDLDPPVFTFVPAAVTSSCAAVPPVGNPIATDNCDTNIEITYDGETRIDGPCPDAYTLRRQWTATDNCGNAVSAEQIITVQDITPPAFTFVPADGTVSCDAVPAVESPTATDNCAAAVTIIYGGEFRTDGDCPDNYTLTRRWTATDNCGNFTTTEQVLTVQDITVPEFLFAPADTVVGCDVVPAPAVPTATDNCDGLVSITYEGETIISSTSPSTYVLERRWIAEDNCGNTAEAVQQLSVRDTVSPVITCPPNVEVNSENMLCSAVATFEAPFTSDNCTVAPVVTGTASSGDVFPIGTTIVVLTSTDESGNTATCSFDVVVADTTAPILVNCPTDMEVMAPGDGCEALVDWTPPTVTDLCDAYPIIPEVNIQPGTSFHTGLTTVIYSAQDTSGNKATCSFVVTVKENVPPMLMDCPTDIYLQTDTCNALANWVPPVATDNCELDTLISNYQPGAVFPETITTVTYTAVDVWGNSTTCSFNVTVEDIVAPEFSGCPDDIVVNSGNDCEIAVDWIMPTATDNCNADPTVTAVPMPGDQYPVGYTNVLVLVEDPSGNTDTCTFKVTVIGPPLGFDNTPDNQSFVGCSAIATWTPPVPTGVCAPITVESNYMPGDTFPVGVTEVMYTVTDTLGYTATTTFTISVTESIPPVFDCPASPVVVDISGAVLTDAGQFIMGTDTVSTCDGVELMFDFPAASDNCGTPSIEQLAGPGSGAFFEIGSHLLEFETTDDAGNTDRCAVEVIVKELDPLNPEISDKIGCEGDDITLSTIVIPGATYIWDGPFPPYPNSNNLLIEDLSPALTGYYTVQARVNGCLTPLDSALVRQAILPDAIDDLDFEVETGALLDSIDVTLNDIFEQDDYQVTLLSPLLGLTQTGNGLFSYQAGLDNGYVSFIYQLCSAACPDLCDEAVVTINVRETFCTYIPNVITPNNDGINDYLEIPCLGSDLYPNNSLVIYNQWGDKIYEASPYDNSPDKAWRGTLDGKDGKNVPDGTYFYFFKPEPNKKALSGFIEVFR
ncbi:MAG: HYR domain-containing protein [Bacteroidetes bacterium]|nr:MAG: HYR domain-containing protein [Bacteroidota bacterium]